MSENWILLSTSLVKSDWDSCVEVKQAPSKKFDDMIRLVEEELSLIAYVLVRCPNLRQ